MAAPLEIIPGNSDDTFICYGIPDNLPYPDEPFLLVIYEQTNTVFPEVLEKSLKILEKSLKSKQINQGISEGHLPMHQLRRDMSNNPRIYQDPRRGRDMLLLVVCGYSATRTPTIGAALSYFWEDCNTKIKVITIMWQDCGGLNAHGFNRV